MPKSKKQISPALTEDKELLLMLDRPADDFLRYYHNKIIPQDSLTSVISTLGVAGLQVLSPRVKEALMRQCFNHGLYDLALSYLPTAFKLFIVARHQEAALSATETDELYLHYLPFCQKTTRSSSIDFAADDHFKRVLLKACLHHNKIVAASQLFSPLTIIDALEKDSFNCSVDALEALLLMIETSKLSDEQTALVNLKQLLAGENDSKPSRETLQRACYLCRQLFIQPDTTLVNLGIALWLKVNRFKPSFDLIPSVAILKKIDDALENDIRTQTYRDVSVAGLAQTCDQLVTLLTIPNLNFNQRRDLLYQFNKDYPEQMHRDNVNLRQVWQQLSDAEKLEHPTFYPLGHFLKQDPGPLYSEEKKRLQSIKAKPEDFSNAPGKTLKSAIKNQDYPEQRAIITQLKQIDGDQACGHEVIDVLRRKRISLLGLVGYSGTPAWAELLNGLDQHLRVETELQKNKLFSNCLTLERAPNLRQ